jgi:hypothetical protein
MDSSSTLLPGDNITVIPDVIGPSTINETTSMSMMAPVVVQVTVGEEVVPDITIDAPSEQAACAPFALDITSSTGFVGRAWQNVSISVRSAMVFKSGLTPVQENATELLSVNEFFATTYDLDAATALPVGYLKAGQLYVFDVELCNCLGSCGKASHRLWVTPAFPPFISHRRDATRTMVRGDILTIPSGVLSFTCLTEENAAVVSVTQVWTVVTAFDPTPLLQVSSDEFQAFVLPAYSFPSASLYEILEVVEVTVSDGVSNERRNSTFKNSVLVQVSKSPVHAALAPEGHMMIAVNDVKWLDASDSYDSNVSPTGVAGVQSAGLHYRWECMRMGPLSVDTPDTNCSGFLRVNASLHTMAMLSPDVGGADVGSEYRITLHAYSADMLEYDSTVILVTVISFCCASIELESTKLYNVKKDLRVSARVQSSTRGYVAWSVSDVDGSLLSRSALTPTTVLFEGTKLASISSYAVNLMLPPNLLQAGFTYTVQLSFFPLLDGQGVSDELLLDEDDVGEVYSTMEVVTNSLPLPGTFTVSPEEGISFLDMFSFRAKH